MLLVKAKALIDTIALEVRYYLVKRKIHILYEQTIPPLDVSSREIIHMCNRIHLQEYSWGIYS